MGRDFSVGGFAGPVRQQLLPPGLVHVGLGTLSAQLRGRWVWLVRCTFKEEGVTGWRG